MTCPTPPARALLGACALLTALLIGAPAARAGGGPETTLVVVNAASPDSWRVANAYAALRKIPATHVCPLPSVPNLLVIDVDTFRASILAPIEAWLDEHGLREEIDCIAYSVDFPYGVDYAKDFDVKSLPQIATPTVASLTGATYLYRLVKVKTAEYLSLTSNRYLRLDKGNDLLPGHGFRSAYAWDRAREPDKAPADDSTAHRYLLSTMLGFTGMQGNTVPEVLACLERAASADGTLPRGTVYLMINKDVRSRTRQAQFPPTCEALEKLGGHGVCLTADEDGQDGKVPIGKDDVIGLVAGIAGFNWPAAKSTMLPGAIAEHLTSFGAKFDGSGQTKISEFIRGGAAGSSGAVTEPYALVPKFPLCSLHVHYAEGCSLAESFYQSLGGPYQLLVIGDPLARPYATFAKVALGSPSTASAWSGSVEVLAQVTPPEGKAIRVVEVWLDGQRIGETPPGAPYALDTTTVPDGAHELRLVAVEDSLVETRSSWIGDVEIDNGNASKLSIKGPKGAQDHGEEIKLSGRASGVQSVHLVAGHRVLAEAKRTSSSWRVELDTSLLGQGTTRVQARAVLKDGAVVLSPFLEVEVRAPGGVKPPKKRRPSRPKKDAEKRAPSGKAGLEVVAVDDKGKEHTFVATTLSAHGKARFLPELRKAVPGKTKKLTLRGELSVDADGAYRLALNAAGRLEVKVRGETVFEGDALDWNRQVYAPLALKAGWHPIEIDYEPTGNGDLSVWIGGDVVSEPLAGKALRH